MKLDRLYRAEVTIPATVKVGAKVFLPDIQKLRNTVLAAIEGLSSAEVSVTNQGVTILRPADTTGITLTLVHASDRRAYHFPYYALLAGRSAGVIKEFDNWRVNWQKSYLTITDNAAFQSGGTQAVTFNIYYKPLK